MLVTGASKSRVLAKAVEGPVTSMISATALQLHANCTAVVDEAAGDFLEQKEYYRWIFENDPQWAAYQGL
jgi:glucosamine-6-phosphate deaminase